MILDGKSLQEYPVIDAVPHSSILGPALFLLHIHNDLPDIIRSIAIDVDDTTLYSKCDQVSVLRQQLKLAFELLSDQQDIVNWGRKTAC